MSADKSSAKTLIQNTRRGSWRILLAASLTFAAIGGVMELRWAKLVGLTGAEYYLIASVTACIWALAGTAITSNTRGWVLVGTGLCIGGVVGIVESAVAITGTLGTVYPTTLLIPISRMYDVLLMPLAGAMLSVGTGISRYSFYDNVGTSALYFTAGPIAISACLAVILGGPMACIIAALMLAFLLTSC